MSKVKLGDVAELITKGTTPTSIGGAFTEFGINFVKSESIANSKYLNADIFGKIDEETDKRLKRSRLKKDDLLFSIAGAYLGKVAIVRDSDVPANTNQAVGIVRLKHDIVDKDYAYYFYSQKHITAYINNLSSQSSQPNLNLDLLGRLQFELKALEDQQKIAAVLSALDAKIACNNRINAELEAMAKTLYDYWFVQFDFPDANGKPYKSSGGKMVYNPTLKREIPAGWGAKSLADVGSFKNGINYDPSVGGNATARIVNVRNVSATTIFLKENDLDVLDLEQADIDKYLVTSDSILIARSGIPGATRMMSFCPPNTIYCGFIICLTVANPEDKLCVFFKMKQIEQSLLSQSSGSILKNVSQDTLKVICFAMPPDDLRSVIQRFNAAINPILGKISLNQQANNELTQLRDWLLPMLMNGQITVA